MNDEELMLQGMTVPTMYFDGFGAFQKINGVLRCVGYVVNGGAQLNLVVSLTGADQAQIDTKRILSENPVKGIQIWRGARLAH